MNSLPYELIQYIYSFMDVRSVLGLSLASKELYKNAPKWRLCHKQLMKKIINEIGAIGYIYSINEGRGDICSYSMRFRSKKS